jgi:hypothetical protein
MWKRINANVTELPPEPWVDFSKKMVVVIFAGNATSGCSGVDVVRTSAQDGVLHVEYAYAPEPEPGTMCTMVVTSPVAAVVVDKFDEVKFERINTTPVKYKRIETKFSTTDMTQPFTAVVSDELKLRKLWTQYADAATPMPSVDFSTQTVLFAWGGLAMPCESTKFTGISRAGGKLYAGVRNSLPGPAVDCLQTLVGTGDVVVIDRSDEPVVFATSTMHF